MDIETIYLFVGVFIISSCMLVVLQRLFKNKSYEEVLAEQRQHTNALFSSQPKPKVKDKKQKKALKKSKEKKSSLSSLSSETVTDDVGDETSDQAEQGEESSKEEVVPPEVPKTNHHPHVEFKEATTVIEEPSKDSKRKPRRESWKPILVNRDSSSELIQDVRDVPQTNHFEESHPKDEFELFSAHNAHAQHARDEKINGENNTKKKKQQQQQHQQQVDKKSKHQVNEITKKSEKEKEKENVQPKEIQPQPQPQQPEVKEEQITATVVQNGLTALPAKDKKKKKSEYNVLTQNHDKSMGSVNLSQMITLVRKADMSKQDVQMLIDVLLNKQHDAPSIIDEWSEGKGDPMQKLKKQLAEKTQLAAELQDTLTGAQNKLRDVRVEQQGERSQLLLAAREYKEKYATLQAQFDQQMAALTAKCKQMQDGALEEANKSRQMVQEFQDMQLQRQELAQQVKNLQFEMDNKQMQLNQLNMQHQSELGQVRQEMQNKCESRFALERQQFNNELGMWREKVQNLEMHKNQEIQTLQKQLEDGKAQAGGELRKIHENLRELENELGMQLSLKNASHQENRKLKDELQKMHEAKTNGSIEQGKQHQMLINQLNMELKNVRNQLENSDKTHQQKTMELEELKNKNNDLRKKNWKVMEALNTAESRVQSSLKSQMQAQASNDKLVTQLAEVPPPEDPKEARAKFLKRVFPSIVSISADLGEDAWDKAVQEAVRDYIIATTAPPVPVAAPVPAPAPTPAPVVVEVEKISEADQAELVKLRAEVATYQKIIDQSEVILCKLQTHVEEEQVRWGTELQSKEDSISRLSEELELKEEQLRQKTESLNEAIITNSHSTNGPTAGLISSVPHLVSVSTDSSATSSVSDIGEKKNKKKKMKKNKENAVTN